MSDRDPNIMGGNRRGRPSKEPRAVLTPAQETEYGKAKAGNVEWVSAAVAAYMLGISTETLRKRRQRKAQGLVPEWQAPKSNRQGARYRWSSVVRSAMPGFDDRQEQQRREIERLLEKSERQEQRLEELEGLLRGLLAGGGHGMAALLTDHAWAVDEHQRILGLAALHPGEPYQPMGWLEALGRHWVHETHRAPYHQVALEHLDDLRRSLEPVDHRD